MNHKTKILWTIFLKTLPSISRRLLRCGWDLSGTDPHRSYRSFKLAARPTILSTHTSLASYGSIFARPMDRCRSSETIYLVGNISNTILVDTWDRAVVRFRLFGINSVLPNLLNACPKKFLAFVFRTDFFRSKFISRLYLQAYQCVFVDLCLIWAILTRPWLYM